MNSNLAEINRLNRVALEMNRRMEFYNGLLSNQVFVPKPLAFHAPHDLGHLLDGVPAPHVMAACKLANVAAQVLDAHLVEGSVKATLE